MSAERQANEHALELGLLRGQCRELQCDLQDARIINDELKSTVSLYQELLEDERLNQQLLADCVDHHKEALIEKHRELADKDQILRDKTFLLEVAWVDLEHHATLEAQKDHLINHLQNAPTNGAKDPVGPNKKRKLSS